MIAAAESTRPALAPPQLAFYMVLLARLPDGSVAAVDIGDVPEHCLGDMPHMNRHGLAEFGNVRGDTVPDGSTPTPAEVAQALERFARARGGA